jgi:hypothetical protein
MDRLRKISTKINLFFFLINRERSDPIRENHAYERPCESRADIVSAFDSSPCFQDFRESLDHAQSQHLSVFIKSTNKARKTRAKKRGNFLA